MSEEPTWEVCRKLVGCPIMSLLIFGRCLINMERVRGARESNWQGTKCLTLDRDQLIGQHLLFICWWKLTRESWLAPVRLRLLLHDTGAEEVDPELASHGGGRGFTGPSWLDSWSSLIADSSRGSCAVRAAAPWHPLSQPATAGVAEEGRKWEQPIYIGEGHWLSFRLNSDCVIFLSKTLGHINLSLILGLVLRGWEKEQRRTGVK